MTTPEEVTDLFKIVERFGMLTYQTGSRLPTGSYVLSLDDRSVFILKLSAVYGMDIHDPYPYGSRIFGVDCSF